MTMCFGLWGLRPQTSYRDSTPGHRWETSVPRLPRLSSSKISVKKSLATVRYRYDYCTSNNTLVSKCWVSLTLSLECWSNNSCRCCSCSQNNSLTLPVRPFGGFTCQTADRPAQQHRQTIEKAGRQNTFWSRRQNRPTSRIKGHHGDCSQLLYDACFFCSLDAEQK